MPCALCLKDEPLKRSHIIPEFLFTPLYDQKHRLEILSVLPDKKNEFKQKGDREPLLCESCETVLSRYERYASLALNGRIPLRASRKGRLIRLSGLDYAQFKLFQLSILWRAGVSKLPLFNRVQLGPHEERLRSLIASENPSTPTDYGCIMYQLTSPDGETPTLIMQPTRGRALGKITYKFTLGGMVWVYFVASTPPPYPFALSVLNSHGEAFIGVGDIREMNDLREFTKELKRLGREPTKKT